MQKKMIKLFEGFAGYGGCSFAFKKAEIEFECVGCSEIDKFAIQCYNQNHYEWESDKAKIVPRNYGDITKIDPKDLPDFDLFTGGFPCQDVSIAGKRDLSKGRTNLFNDIIRIAEVKQPKYMILENVKGLLSMNKGAYWKNIRNELCRIGYGITYKVMNSKDYGIPQNRERIWILCKLGGWSFNEMRWPKKEELKLTIKDILEEKVDKKYYLTDKQIATIKSRDRFGDHILGPNQKVHPALLAIGQCDVGIIKIADFRFDEGLRIRKDNISPCLAASNKETISNSVLIHNKNWRRLTPKECFRLMGFINDEIKLDNISDSQCYKLAGNGWDINLVSKILKNLFKED